MKKQLTISDVVAQMHNRVTGPVNFISTLSSAPRLESVNEMLVLPLTIVDPKKEVGNAKIIYLAFTSRLLKEPFSVSVRGQSAASFVQQMLELMPEEDRLYLPVDASKKQPWKVMREAVILTDEKIDAMTRPWRAYQRWLAKQNVPDIIIPYEAWLAENMNLQALWIRRAFKTVLSVIRARALLYINLHLRDSKGRIIAMLEDYKRVYKLVEPILRKVLRNEVPKEVWQVVEAVRALTAGKREPTTILAIAKYLQIGQPTASKRIQEAIDLGLLRNLEDRRNKPAKLILGDNPSGVHGAILPKPAKLEEKALIYAPQVYLLGEDGTPVAHYPAKILGTGFDGTTPMAILAEDPYLWPLGQCRYIEEEDEGNSENFSESSQNP